MRIWQLLASVFGSLSTWHWIVVLMFLLLVVTPPGLVVGPLFFGADGKAATERAATDNDGWTTYLDTSGAIIRKFISGGTTSDRSSEVVK